MSFKNYFESLSKVQKIEVYIIILMIYVLVFVFYEDFFFSKYKVIPQQIHVENNAKIIEPKYINDIEIIKYIEKQSDVFLIVIKETQIKNNNLHLNITGDFENIMNFLKSLQSNFNILEYEMIYKINSINVYILLDSKFYFKEKNLNNENISNPFIKKVKIERKKKTFFVKAIISSEVLISDTWYTIGDEINNYKIISIEKNRVKLIDNKTKEVIIKEVTNG